MNMPLSLRYQTLFNRLEQNQQACFIPFITLGDPNLETSLAIIHTLVKQGADALELGFPFSDPLADGPVIQKANFRALTAGINPEICFNLIYQIRKDYPDLPIGVLTYANLVYANTIDQFYKTCHQTGIDSVLIADVPILESAPFRKSAQTYGIHSIYILPPNPDSKTLKQIAHYGSGYTYLLSRAGVTGERDTIDLPTQSLLKALQANQAAEIIMGFGISTPKQVANLVKSGIKGVISGSAVIKLIETSLLNQETQEETLKKLARFINAMKSATLLKEH